MLLLLLLLLLSLLLFCDIWDYVVRLAHRSVKLISKKDEKMAQLTTSSKQCITQYKFCSNLVKNIVHLVAVIQQGQILQLPQKLPRNQLGIHPHLVQATGGF